MRRWLLALLLAAACRNEPPAKLSELTLLAPGEGGTALLRVRGSAANRTTLFLDCKTPLREVNPAELAAGVRIAVPWSKAGSVKISAGEGCAGALVLELPKPPSPLEDRLHRAGFADESAARSFLSAVLARQRRFEVPERVRAAVAAKQLVPFGAARKPLQNADIDCDGVPDTLVLAVEAEGALGRALAAGTVPGGDALADAVLEVRKLDGEAFGRLVVVRSGGATEVHGAGEFEVVELPACDKYDRAWAAARGCKAVDHGATESQPGMTLVFDHRTDRLEDVRCE